MLIQLALATLMVTITVFIHGAGLILLTRWLRLEAREEAAENIAVLSRRGVLATLGVVLGLFVLHGAEIWLYGALFLTLGAVPDLETAIYFSTITYAAIGYSDSALDPGWRLVAAIEGINGIILIGWSTAFFVTLVARLGRRG